MDDAKHALKQLIDDDEGGTGVPSWLSPVMNNHTYTHRIGTILEKIGIDSEIEFYPKISITCTNRPEMISNILENYDVAMGK